MPEPLRHEPLGRATHPAGAATFGADPALPLLLGLGAVAAGGGLLA